MQLGPEKVQKVAEEGVWGQSKTSLQMGRQEDPLPFVRFWLRFVPWQPPRPFRDEAVGDEILHVPCRHS